MSAFYRLTVAPGHALTSTCRTCGATFTHPNYTYHRAWRDAHNTQCTPPDNHPKAA